MMAMRLGDVSLCHACSTLQPARYCKADRILHDLLLASDSPRPRFAQPVWSVCYCSRHRLFGDSRPNLTVKRYGRWSSEAREQWEWIKKLDKPVDAVARGPWLSVVEGGI